MWSRRTKPSSIVCVALWGASACGARAGLADITVGDACSEPGNHWQAIIPPPEMQTVRQEHCAVWTGEELIVWGGIPHTGGVNDILGFRYRPRDGSFRTMSKVGALPKMACDVAVWTGEEVLFLGNPGPDGLVAPSARYRPSDDSWRPMSTVGAPVTRNPSAVWTGQELIVWGGRELDSTVADGFAYRPDSDSWRPISAVGAPPPSWPGTLAVWTGTEMILAVTPGFSYHPVSDSWTTLPPGGPANFLRVGALVWTGEEVVAWSPDAGNAFRYHVASDTWTPMSAIGAPTTLDLYSVVFGAGKVVFWGWGSEGFEPSISGGSAYLVASDTWMDLPNRCAPPRSLESSTVTWVGTGLLLWGGAYAAATPEQGWFLPASAIGAEASR